MMYLGFVLSLTSSCYCAGLFITWTRRHKFKKYEELKLENRHRDGDSSDDFDDYTDCTDYTSTYQTQTETERTEAETEFHTETEVSAAEEKKVNEESTIVVYKREAANVESVNEFEKIDTKADAKNDQINDRNKFDKTVFRTTIHDEN